MSRARWASLVAGLVVAGSLVTLHAPTDAATHRDGAKRTKVTEVTPATGPVEGGTKVEVRGQRFTRSSKVFFGRTPARRTKFKSSRLLVARVPQSKNRIPGTTTVNVRTGGQRSLGGADYRYTLAVDTGGSRAAFVTASGQVACVVNSDADRVSRGYQVRCEVTGTVYPAPPPPPGCVTSYGDVFVLTTSGAYILCAGDTEAFYYANTETEQGSATMWWDPFRQLRVQRPGETATYAGLKPGNSLVRGTLSCTAETNTATCRDSGTGHTLTVSPTGYSLG